MYLMNKIFENAIGTEAIFQAAKLSHQPIRLAGEMLNRGA
jgi:hypothetical protein